MADNKFSLDMTVAQAMQMTPKTAGILAAFGVGGCAHCQMASVETLEQVCGSYNIEPQVLMDALEGAVAE